MRSTLCMKSARYAIILFLATLLGSAAAHAQTEPKGVTQMFITYRCDPANRVAFIKGLEGEGIKRFDEWKRTGVIGDYLLLYNNFVDANTWDAMVTVTFNDYAQTEKWRAVDKNNPGGLSAEMLKIASPHTTYLADMLVRKGSAGDQSKSIYVVIPYDYTDRGTYVNYIRTYGVPQFDGWIREGAITSYSIFLNQHAPGAPWDALLLFEYKGIEGLAMREVIKQKVRAGLAADPSWKLLSDTKLDFRVEREVVMASAVQSSGR